MVDAVIVSRRDEPIVFMFDRYIGDGCDQLLDICQPLFRRLKLLAVRYVDRAESTPGPHAKAAQEKT